NSSELAREFPDEVPARAKDSIDASSTNCRKYILPVLGDLPVDAISVEHCDQVKRKLNPELRPNSRRQALTPIKTILDLCVQPLRLIERSPLPERWLPRDGGPRQLQWLYPSEDVQLMAATTVPLWLRVLCGYLIREGGRLTETLHMTLGHFDLERGTARLDAGMTKTRRARLWKLDPGTVLALQRWVELARAGAKPGDRMFVNGQGRRIMYRNKPQDGVRDRDFQPLPHLLREALRTAGVSRQELFGSTADARQLVIHDLRASFVTTKLALDWSEAKISQRTGHMSSGQLRQYQRLAQTFQELHVGDFTPLHEAVPELNTARRAERPTRPAAPVHRAPVGRLPRPGRQPARGRAPAIEQRLSSEFSPKRSKSAQSQTIPESCPNSIV
ncbi:MAG TPA: tyrosine-type recombinase/integrase, partial [Polyangiales bacterium]|nr:tyrosine-type recombinase/integrase [Polyangiales bacterium]